MKPYIFLTQGFDSPPASNIFKIFFLVKIISIFNYVVICHPACEGAGGVFFQRRWEQRNACRRCDSDRHPNVR